MPGKHITNQQANLYMKQRQQGKTQQQAAAKAGLCPFLIRIPARGQIEMKKPLKINWLVFRHGFFHKVFFF